MVRRLGERFKQYVGNYEIIANDNITESEELFIDTANRVGAAAYAINDMNRFIGDILEEVEDEVSDEEWKSLTSDLNKILYALENCKVKYSNIYNKLNRR